MVLRAGCGLLALKTSLSKLRAARKAFSDWFFAVWYARRISVFLCQRCYRPQTDPSLLEHLRLDRCWFICIALLRKFLFAFSCISIGFKGQRVYIYHHFIQILALENLPTLLF